MKKKRILPDMDKIPPLFHPLMNKAEIYDSSSSKEAQVFFIHRDKGFFLKSAAKGTLEKEAKLTQFFHEKQLAPEMLSYASCDRDWLLTESATGEDCTHSAYLDSPERLCDTIAEQLRKLHDLDYTGCPVPNRTKDYLAAAAHNCQAGSYDLSLFSDNWCYASAEDARNVLEGGAHLLKTDTLLHGDYCLPNIILDNWRFSSFIDLGCAGVGDKHIDLFWGIWTLWFNLKTNKYQQRFLDAYGRRDIEPEMFRIIAAIEVFG